MSVVTLVSGGLDSTIMSLFASEEGIRTAPLFVDYGQLGAAREWAACRLLYERHGLPTVVRMDVSGFGHVVPSGITTAALRINEDAFLPGRNLLLLLCGAAYAYTVGANSVAIGLLRPESSLFPDQTSDFLLRSEEAIEMALGRRIAVIAPLRDLTKADVIEMAGARGVEGAYSCHAGGSEPCGRCVACTEIINAKG